MGWERPVCTERTYDLLDKANILSIAQNSRDGLKTLFLYRTVWEGAPKQTLEELKSSKDATLSEDLKDALDLEQKLDSGTIFDINPVVFEHPFLVARMVLGKELDNFGNYGFNSKKDFATAVATYCMEEKDHIDKDIKRYCWRNKNFRNFVDLSTHGDLHVSQTDLSDTTGKIVLTDPTREGFGIKQDWSPFLVSVLKYSQLIGKQEIPEIKNWRETAVPIRTSNFWGSKIPDRSDDLAFGLEGMFDRGIGPSDAPLFINDNTISYFRDGNLEFLREHKEGDIELYQGRLKMKKFMTFTPDDLTHLLKANYKLYARSVSDMAQIMDHFNEVAKKK